MTEQENYKKLSELMKQKDKWEESIDYVAGFLDTAPKLQAKALWMMGEMGLLYPKKVENYLATNTPKVYVNCMPIFKELLYDNDTKVRMEAPEIYRVIGKRVPKYVIPYLEELEQISEKDDNEVVRIHAEGAIRITRKAMEGAE